MLYLARRDEKPKVKQDKIGKKKKTRKQNKEEQTVSKGATHLHTFDAALSYRPLSFLPFGKGGWKKVFIPLKESG